MTLDPTRPVRFYLAMGPRRKDVSLAHKAEDAKAKAGAFGRDGAVLQVDVPLVELLEIGAVTPLWHAGHEEPKPKARQELLQVADPPRLIVGGHGTAAAAPDDGPDPAPAPAVQRPLVGAVR